MMADATNALMDLRFFEAARRWDEIPTRFLPGDYGPEAAAPDVSAVVESEETARAVGDSMR